MKSIWKYLLVFWGVFVGCGKEAPDTPTDSPPTIASFAVQPTSGKQGVTIAFSGRAVDDRALSLVELDYGDLSNIDTLHPSASAVDPGTVSASHKYIVRGVFQAILRVRDDAGQLTSRTISVPIDANLPPLISGAPLAFNEGDSLVLAKSALVTDLENDPFTASFRTSASSGLAVKDAGTNILLKGIDDNTNGIFALIVNAEYVRPDGAAYRVEVNVPVSITPLDIVQGYVVDALKGTWIGELEPGLVALPPYRMGWVRVDGNRVRVDLATGFFKTEKLPSRTHVVERGGFVTMAGDSAFGAVDNLPPGDQVLDAVIHTTRGTGLNLRQMHDFLWEANFGVNVNPYTSGRLKGINFSAAQLHHYYLAGKDTTIGGRHLRGLTPQMQSDLADRISTSVLSLLPSHYRPGFITAAQGESIPVRSSMSGYAIPIPRMAWVSYQVTGADGSIETFDEDGDFATESAVIRYLYPPGSPGFSPSGFSWTAVDAKALSWLCAPGSVTNPNLPPGVSILQEQGRASTLMGVDKKLLWMVVKHGPGTSSSQYWRL